VIEFFIRFKLSAGVQVRQTSFFKQKDFPKEFGGELLKRRRKSRRPLSTKRPIHNVLRANLKTGSFVKYRNKINSVLKEFSQRFNVRIYKLGIARDHIHLVIKVDSRNDYSNFVRAVTGVLAKLFKFRWLFRPFTRVIEWGRDFKRVCQYVLQNDLEGLGLIPYQKRRTKKRVPT